MALKLVQLGLSGVAMFGPDREVLQPSEVLRKKAILVERGSFRPPTRRQHRHAGGGQGEVRARTRPWRASEILHADRAHDGATCWPAAPTSTGATSWPGPNCSPRAAMTVLISDYFDYYRLAAYIARRTDERIGIVMGVPSLIDLFDERNHAQLPGGILESFGRLFKNDLRLFVYPYAAVDGRRAQDRRRHQGPGGSAAAVRLPGRPGQLRRPGQLPARTTCPSSAATCSGGSPPATNPGRAWCPTRSPR